MPELFSVSIQLKRPSPDDPRGAAEWAKYYVEGGDLVVLCDGDGKPLPRQARRVGRRRGPTPLVRWERKLGSGEDAHRVARELLMERHRATQKGTDFSRPIKYPPLGIY
jgi:hypothetical protein